MASKRKKVSVSEEDVQALSESFKTLYVDLKNKFNDITIKHEKTENELKEENRKLKEELNKLKEKNKIMHREVIDVYNEAYAKCQNSAREVDRVKTATYFCPHCEKRYKPEY